MCCVDYERHLCVQVSIKNLSFVHVEVVDDDADKQVESEERTKDDEQNKIQVHQRLVFQFWLHVRLHSTIRHVHRIRQLATVNATS